ncbi:hypothetical protein [Amycolatopsis sp. CA-230715]|uniref:hypothetical protein n=1 Tax=Amycolatopsis sp. CA-230715 TaxID=2745196 RepID=UPI001C0239C5|nr:hypothetical protein [Amycolatopsis sp. CA-230715]QWF80060.1 hypothetical protein HUW46_03475 [Amycolatopsis sp. CA-230715]
MIDPAWVFVSAALGLVGSARYAFATVKGTVRPNLVTWSLWAAAPLIGFFAQLDAEVGLPAVQTLSAGLGPLVVVICGVLIRHNLARLGAFDVICAVIAIIALGIWLGYDDAPLAVLFAVAADAAAALPTVVKAWRDPGSENVLFYVLVGTGATVTLLTISSWEPAAWAFPVYMLVLCSTLIGIVAARPGARRHRCDLPADPGIRNLPRG